MTMTPEDIAAVPNTRVRRLLESAQRHGLPVSTTGYDDRRWWVIRGDDDAALIIFAIDGRRFAHVEYERTGIQPANGGAAYMRRRKVTQKEAFAVIRRMGGQA